MPVLMETTTVPRWSAESADPAPGHTIDVDFTDTASTDTASTGPALERAGRSTSVRAATAGPETLRVLEAVADGSVVGTRLRVVGAEPAVTAVVSWARGYGFEDVEIEAHVPGGDALAAAADRAVVCAHCHHVTTVRCRVGDPVDCAGCAAPLTVYHHFSISAGGYLAYRPDAEELP